MRLILENGEERHGEVRFNSLELRHRREIDGESREQRDLMALAQASSSSGALQTIRTDEFQRELRA